MVLQWKCAICHIMVNILLDTLKISNPYNLDF